jgi:serine/threonine protein phosphatase PrpC
VRSAWLKGCDHLELGAIETRAEAAAAVALSIGGAKKAYSHTDPNEDGALFALGDGGALLAVVDGHGGTDAADTVLGHLLDHWAPRWIAADSRLSGAWQSEALAALVAANEAITKQAADGGRRHSRTTLALAVVRPAEGFLFFLSIGDSHVYQVRRDAAHDLACELSPTGEGFFLGVERETEDSLREKCVIGAETLVGVRAVVLASDGLSERQIGVDDPDVTVAEVVQQACGAPLALRALETARGVVQAALEAHRRQPSGDNVATAVLWLEP